MPDRHHERTAVPTYKLFGEQRLWPTPEPVHYETIAERSALHDWEISPHSHDNLVQLLFLESGAADMTLEDRVLALAPPCLVYVPARTVHGFRFSADIVGHIVTLPEYLPAELLAHALEARAGLAATAHWPLHDDGDDEDMFQAFRMHFAQLAREYRGRGAGRVGLMLATLSLMLIHVARMAGVTLPEPGRDRFRQRVERFAELIENHFREWRPLAFYADRLGVSTAQLNNTCRRETGHSAQHMLHQRLLLEARRLLAFSDLDVTAIAYALGFKDPAYFSRFFTRHEGVAPSGYRGRHWGG